MRLTEDEFWNLTLAQWLALCKQHELDEERLDYRAALIASIIAEVNRNHKKRREPFSPQDFMPQRSPAKANQAKRGIDVDSLILINAAVGGKLTEKKRG